MSNYSCKFFQNEIGFLYHLRVYFSVFAKMEIFLLLEYPQDKIEQSLWKTFGSVLKSQTQIYHTTQQFYFYVSAQGKWKHKFHTKTCVQSFISR